MNRILNFWPYIRLYNLIYTVRVTIWLDLIEIEAVVVFLHLHSKLHKLYKTFGSRNPVFRNVNVENTKDIADGFSNRFT